MDLDRLSNDILIGFLKFSETEEIPNIFYYLHAESLFSSL